MQNRRTAMSPFQRHRLVALGIAVTAIGAATLAAGEVTFTRTTLNTIGETNAGYVAIADLNGDGTADIVAGLQWFEGPSWTRHPLYPTDANTLIDIGKTVPYDVDRDGDLDLVANRRPQELFWFENPGPPSTGTWTKHHITRKVKYPELLMFVDIDGDGRDEMVGSDDGPGYGIRIYEIPDDPRKSSSWSWTTVDDSPLHGLGIGDLNQDGRLDLISDFVWFQQTASGGWTKHSLPAPDENNRGRLTMQINVSDVDGDGDQDVLLTRAHNYGAFWLESSGGHTPRFTLHEILPGSLPSQLHGVAYGDIDGDGDVDMFAGACRYRHGDPGEKDPLDVFWVELVRKEGNVSWVKHQLATDLIMGFNPTIGDIDGDGDMDLALRGLGLGGKYIIGARQTDVTLFIQNASVTAAAELTAKSARSITLRPPDSGPWVALLVKHGVASSDVTFTRTRLTTIAETNMGHVPMADINGDGVIDIVAGLQWFEGPSWKRHPLYPPDTKPTAIDIGFTVPYDLDGDGDLDLMTHRRSSDDRNKNELFWFENPGAPSTGVWIKHHITWDTRWPEVIIFVDIDGDGRDEMVCSDVCPGKGIRIYEVPQYPENASSWSWTTVDKSPLHGLGIGDLNEDGRLDIVSDFVWFEQDTRGGWIRHSLPSPGSARRGHETMQIKVYDVDADGDMDLILPRAHHYGAYWLESSGGKKPSFKLHEILPGKLPSQLHGVAYADIDGDGDLDIFAGKSRYRHGDPGNDEPLDVFWIELVRSSGRVGWVKHQLATDLTMGIGPTIADVDADGDMDLVLRGHGIGGRYVIGARQTDVTLFIQNGSVAATAELTAKSARSVTLHPPAEETALPYGNRQGSMRVIYDNDQTRDVYTDEIMMAMASAGRIQLVGMITTRTVNGIGYDKYDELVAERRQMVNLARKSGMRRLPDPVKGPRVSLQPPASGKIDDTMTIGTDGSRLIVREARKASPSNPLVVICGGQLTAVADAYLLDPSIEDKVVVAALLGHKDDMGGFNGLQDPWAAYIVLQRLIYVQIPERLATPQVPKKWLHKALPDTPLKQWMIAKIHPLFPDRLPGDFDYDGQPVLPLLTNDYVTEVKRVVFGGWKSKRFGEGSVRIPTFASVPQNGESRALVVVKANGKVGTQAWQAAMAASAAEPMSIIPGAAGFGMETPAGSGRHLDVPKTRVIKVTNLNTGGPGSLSAALEVEGPRVVVFEVSGNIDFTPVGGLSIKHPYITVAGQTAPSPGITLKGCELNVRASDVLLQHIRVRVGDLVNPNRPIRNKKSGWSQWSERDCMKVCRECRGVVIDHCSFSWATDENVQTRGGNLTFIHNIFSEGLDSAKHHKGGHSRGLLIMKQGKDEGQNIAVIGNLFVHNKGRNPAVNGGAVAVVANNLVDNAHFAMKGDCTAKRGHQLISAVGNVIKRTRHPVVARAKHPDTRYYFAPDNIFNSKTFDSVADVWKKVFMPFEPGVPEVNRASVAPIAVPGLTVRPAYEVEEWVLANAGARPADRDPVDKRIVSDVRNGAGTIIASQKDVGGWPKLAENHRKLTIPDNPNGDDDGDGYTNLEEWLHGYAAEVEGKGKVSK